MTKRDKKNLTALLASYTPDCWQNHVLRDELLTKLKRKGYNLMTKRDKKNLMALLASYTPDCWQNHVLRDELLTKLKREVLPCSTHS